MRTTWPLSVLLSLVLLAPSTARPAPATTDFPGLETIRAADLMETVGFLASPRLQGRLAGGPGYWTAAREMAARFRQAGLEPGGDGGFFQRMDVEYEEIRDARLEILRPDGTTRALRLGPDFTCRGFTGSGDLTAPVVFAGYGLSEPGAGYDDYAGLDARGKVVLAFKAAPPFKVDTLGWDERAMPRPRGRTAAARGARALVIAAVGDPERLTMPIGSVLEGSGPEDERFPRLMVSVPVAQELMGVGAPDLGALKAAIDSTRSPASRPCPATLRLVVKARYQARRPSANVVAVLRGSDPALRDQYVVVGAHLDHVGQQAGLLFPGANDNASGSAAVLAVARACAAGGTRPKRSMVYVLFSSEESGLDGARRFVERPPVPLDKVVAMLNLDCVGVGDSIQIGSGKTSPRLWRLARDLDAAGARLTVEQTWGGGGADATPFADRGIPTLYFASRFSYWHLHQPGDTPGTLNPSLYEELTRLAYRTAWAVAQGGYAGE